MIGIYKITNPKGKVYIGQSNNIDKRWRAYKQLRCKKQPKIHNSLVKYGVDNHVFEIVTECSTENINEFERYYQEVYNCIGKNGLNCALVDDGMSKRQYSECTRVKQSEIAKKRVISEERREKLRLTMKKLYSEGKLKIGIKGESMTEEKKNKIRIGNLGKKCTEEQKERMRIAQKGKIVSLEARIKSSISHKGKRLSEETKIKLSLALKGRKQTEEHKINARQARINNSASNKVVENDHKISLENLNNENI